MKNNKIIINSGIVLVFIAIILGVASHKLFGESSKEINASKQFMYELYSMKAIDTTDELTDLKYEKVKTINSQNELVNKTIVTQNYGIDLDNDNNIVGFAKKDIKRSSNKISDEKARKKADEYLMEICGNDLIFKEKKDEKDLPYYSFTYTKKENGYKLYFDEIKININRESGYIDGYSNTTIQKQCSDPKISISEEEAENIAYDSFSQYNTQGEVMKDTELVYAYNKNDDSGINNLELCYVVSIKTKKSDESEVMFKIFVNADNGEVYNSIKENMENEVLTN
ncbi:YcdB/YcdC domain-containing protein [uncultured Clostridium sp.]|uniref:YcdB/YcdC domain-containing protein n=1 Tax=uncultured Clostridium sp. TaxID=59620 RepID=UPI0025EC495C|nr:YcdB/YcdC domain-containing protein [uncultured Clostridium sp.]